MRAIPALEQGYTMLEAPELFQFERPGQFIAGLLVNVSLVQIGGQPKAVPQYLFQKSDGKQFKLLGTYDIVQKLTATRKFVGYLVRIEFRGEDQEIKRGDNAMKIFAVQVKRLEQQQQVPFVPSDEDVPF